MTDELDRLRAENAALAAERHLLQVGFDAATGLLNDARRERDRLRAGLEEIRYFSPRCESRICAILAGADLRDPAQAEAVRQGTWRKEHVKSAND